VTQHSLFDDALAADPDGIVAEAADELNVEDAVEGETSQSQRFSITSYGADLSVFDLVRRIGQDLLIPPAFQRKFVWSQKQASRFIESILMGLPVPGIFLYGQKGRQQLIVDGQQRLITLDRYLKGVWETRNRQQGDREIQTVTPFKLVDVSAPWDGKTFAELDDEEQEVINSYLIHATMFRQDGEGSTGRSIYEVFERINTGGSRLSPQEIRSCVSHGPFVEFLNNLNAVREWREIYGKPSPRVKDEELILRFFALLDRGSGYRRPMANFLDKYLDDCKDITETEEHEKRRRFVSTVNAIHSAIGARKAFRPENALNAAVFDAVMIGCATLLDMDRPFDGSQIKRAYDDLLADEEFQGAYKRATADDESVKTRLNKAIYYFTRP
jgi:hypothetical protein